ncbi:peptidoglycan DD-metalloendopeptidase family protein, partial [Aeromonas salmonicida]|uniref:peptidoglycan DD-metalloendopeptidase family protein n=1 Tax=Aeromonas salmonicida TaxID=645 RepID=UPI003D318F53
GFGMLLVIDHENGYKHIEGKKQAMRRQGGQNVEQGEPVALVGDSGGQDRPALYLEIRHQGEGCLVYTSDAADDHQAVAGLVGATALKK